MNDWLGTFIIIISTVIITLAAVNIYQRGYGAIIELTQKGVMFIEKNFWPSVILICLLTLALVIKISTIIEANYNINSADG